MCNPVFIPIAIAAVASAYSAVASIQGAKLERSMLDYQASIEKQKYLQTLEAGRLEVKKSALASRQAAGAQKAALGASGTVSTAGTNVDVIAENAALGQMDTEIIRQNYQRQAYTHLNNITMLENQKAQAKYVGQMGAVGSLLTLSSTAANMLAKSGNLQLQTPNTSAQMQQQQPARNRQFSYSKSLLKR